MMIVVVSIMSKSVLDYWNRWNTGTNLSVDEIRLIWGFYDVPLFRHLSEYVSL